MREQYAKSRRRPLRAIVLPALPVQAAAEAFARRMAGPPNLRTPTALVVAREPLNLADEQALDRLIFVARVHYRQ